MDFCMILTCVIIDIEQPWSNAFPAGTLAGTANKSSKQSKTNDGFSSTLSILLFVVFYPAFTVYSSYLISICLSGFYSNIVSAYACIKCTVSKSWCITMATYTLKRFGSDNMMQTKAFLPCEKNCFCLLLKSCYRNNVHWTNILNKNWMYEWTECNVFRCLISCYLQLNVI